ncbi:MAG: N-formylglutamate amidohydrolase [Rhodospirillales bacterium]
MIRRRSPWSTPTAGGRSRWSATTPAAPPRRRGAGGLDDAALSRHIGRDIGAAELTRRLAHAAGCPGGAGWLFAAGHRSQPAAGRPAIDPRGERRHRHPRQRRTVRGSAGGGRRRCTGPIHHAVDQAFARLRRRGRSRCCSRCTPSPAARRRGPAVDLGVLWNRDPRIAVPLIEILREADGLQVGDNQPYSGKEIAYTLNLHAGSAGLAHCAIEVRQDHCESEGDLERFAELLAGALERILAMPNLHRVEDF